MPDNRRLVVTENMSANGVIEFIDDWFDPGVAGVVPKQCLDPVRSIGRFLEERHALRRQVLERFPAVVGLEKRRR
jgi:hypothetical protein